MINIFLEKISVVRMFVQRNSSKEVYSSSFGRIVFVCRFIGECRCRYLT